MLHKLPVLGGARRSVVSSPRSTWVRLPTPHSESSPKDVAHTPPADSRALFSYLPALDPHVALMRWFSQRCNCATGPGWCAWPVAYTCRILKCVTLWNSANPQASQACVLYLRSCTQIASAMNAIHLRSIAQQHSRRLQSPWMGRHYENSMPVELGV